MTNWMMLGTIGWFVMIGVTGFFTKNWRLMWYVVGGTIINISVMGGLK